MYLLKIEQFIRAFCLFALYYFTCCFAVPMIMDQSTSTSWTSYTSYTSYTTLTSWVTGFNRAADVSYGSFYYFCFLIETIGNFISFFHFKSKKRDISNFIYMLITANDIMVSIAALKYWEYLLHQTDNPALFLEKSSVVLLGSILNGRQQYY